MGPCGMEIFDINFIFLTIHIGMNAMGLVQSKCHVNFALNPLRSYLEECQKNEIHIYICTF